MEEDIVEKIKWLHKKKPEGGNIELSLLADEGDVFINLPENIELKRLFDSSKYREYGWRWHQLVRMVLQIDPDIKQYMYDRSLSLILKHRHSHDKYFEIKNENGKFRIPNSLAELNRLLLIYNKYLSIFKRIVDQIHFDNARIQYYGPNIKGKIDWTRTLTKSRSEFPLMFSSDIRKREFETSENILLLLCGEWLNRESTRLLSIRFDDPLTEYNKDILRYIGKQTRIILQKFPIRSVLNSSRRYSDLSYNDRRIVDLECETKKRLTQGLVRNANYELLLKWIEEFRELDMENITASTPSQHIIEPITNIDTMYEIWIFMEFVEFLYEKKLLIDFQLGVKSHCKFIYNSNIITFWYERIFTESDHSWIQTHKPDFTAMVNNKIIAVFDAKNYSKTSDTISDSINKMLAYMINLDANFGALLYPYHPKNWHDMDKSERIGRIIPFISSKESMMNEYEINKTARKYSRFAWEELPAEYQDCFPRNIKKHKYPLPGRKARYHLDQTLCLIRMYPSATEQAVTMKELSLNSIFEEIVTRIPLTIEVR